MTSKRKLVRAMWLKIRTKDENGAYTPSWTDFKKDYIKENPSTKENA